MRSSQIYRATKIALLVPPLAALTSLIQTLINLIYIA